MFGFGNRQIYLDYASACPVDPQALSAMRRAETLVGNPGAIHAEGVAAKNALEAARASVARELACKPREVIFTSGLTEANNLAIVGHARYLERLRRLEKSHWIVSAIEHDAVLESFSEVERMGAEVTQVQPNEKGVITAEAILRAMRPETVFISIGWANNETGVIQPLREIAQSVRKQNDSVLLHSDAGQAPLYIAPHVHTLGLDLLALGANKIYGPHGAGALYVSNRAQLARVLHGGKQERGLRAGTENVALCAGFAEALQIASHRRNADRQAIEKLRDFFLAALQSKLPDLAVNGDLRSALPHMLNISVPGIDAEYVALSLSERGVSVSTKSACREGEESESHVVRAMAAQTDGAAWRAQNSLRISLGRETSKRGLEKAANIFKECADLSCALKKV